MFPQLALENLALRQQLAVLARRAKRAKLSTMDRAFWVALTRLWPDWHRTLTLVKPATVIGWHRKGFALYWARKSRRRAGRPLVDAEVRALIRQTAADNVGWGAPRIHGELLKLDFVVSDLHCAAAIGYFVVPSAPRSPWQHPYVERVIGSIGRECTDQIIVLGADHLRRVPRLSVIPRPRVGGLHHRYERCAA